MPTAISSGEFFTVPKRGFGNRRHEGILLVVDDTCASGRQIDRLRTLIQAPMKFAAIYVENRPTIAVDYYHAKVPDFAQFYEWTMFHDDNNRRLLTDLDGVLCEDWHGGNEDEHPEAYAEFLANVRPRRIPTLPSPEETLFETMCAFFGVVDSTQPAFGL